MKKVILRKSVLEEIQALYTKHPCCDAQAREYMADVITLRSFGRYSGVVYKDDVLLLLRRRINKLPVGCCRNSLLQLYYRIAFGCDFPLTIEDGE